MQNDKFYSPNSSVIYAVGDVHGRVDLLRKIHQLIIDDSQKYTMLRKVIVYLGDYVDRGYESKAVLDELIYHLPKNFEPIFLWGNHELAMARFLQNPTENVSWLLSWGGDATLHSYGVDVLDLNNVTKMHKQLQEKMPSQHVDFFDQLKEHHIEGDYLFVHAGLRPKIALEKQNGNDLLFIRDDFIYSDYDFGKMVVFGHTIFEKPFIAKGRLGLDTGAYASGCLTAAILHEDKISFLNT